MNEPVFAGLGKQVQLRRGDAPPKLRDIENRRTFHNVRRLTNTKLHEKNVSQQMPHSGLA